MNIKMINRPILIVIIFYVLFWLFFESPSFEGSIFSSVFVYHFFGLITAFLTVRFWILKRSKSFYARIFRIFLSSLLALVSKILIALIFFKVMGLVFDISVTRLYYGGDFFLKGYRIDLGSFLIFFSLLELAFTAQDNLQNGESEKVDHSIKVMFIKSGKEMISLHSNHIRYVQGLKDYVKIHTLDGVEVTKKTMKGMMEQLPDSDFYRVHKSYIINLKHIDRISGNMIVIGKDDIPIGATYKEDFLKTLNSSII